jgi:hypothetical protein
MCPTAYTIPTAGGARSPGPARCLLRSAEDGVVLTGTELRGPPLRRLQREEEHGRYVFMSES